jgi:hypothetical protein
VIFPLVYKCEARDVVMAHLTPAEQRDIPSGSHAIMNRMRGMSLILVSFEKRARSAPAP